MFGKSKRNKKQSDEPQQPVPPPKPERPRAEHHPTGSPIDHRPEPPVSPPAAPMMTNPFTPNAPSATKADQPAPKPVSNEPEPVEHAAATEAEATLRAIDDALSQLAMTHELEGLADSELNLAQRFESFSKMMSSERARLSLVEEERLNAVGQFQEAQQRLESIERERDEARAALQQASSEQPAPDQPQHDERLAQLEAELRSHQARMHEVEAERDSANAELIRLREEQQNAHQHDADRVSRLEQEMKELHQQIESAVSERDGANAENERLRSEQQHSQQDHERVSQLEQELHALREQTSAAESQRDGARQELDRLREEHQRSEQGRSEHQSRIDELTGTIGAMEERVAQAENKENELGSELEALRQQISEAAEQRNAACAERDALAQKLGQKAEFEVGPDEFCERRRARLNNVRNALGSRSQQLYKVKQVLEHKARELKDAGEARRQAEQMLFEAREQKAMTQRVFTGVQSIRAKGAAGVFVACLTIAWVALLGASWVGVSMFVPVEHNARVGIACDTRGLPDPDASAQAWTAFALALNEDPMFLERAAQRLKTRSYEELASPSDLRDYLAQNAVFDSPGEGRIDITIRGEGRDRTERVLETFATAVVGFANETRERRSDNAPASVVEPASAESTPVDDPRPAIAAGVAGGLTALLLITAIAAWRSARRSLVEGGREALAEIDTHQQSHYETPPAGAEGGQGMGMSSGV